MFFLFELFSGKAETEYRKEVTYEADITAIFPLEVGKVLAYQHSFENKQKGLRWEWDSQIEVTAQETVRIGGCAYRAWGLKDTGSFKRSDGMERTTGRFLTYIPELKYVWTQAIDRPMKFDKVRPMRRWDGFVVAPPPDHVQAFVAAREGDQ